MNTERRGDPLEFVKKMENAKVINLDVSLRTVLEAATGGGTSLIDPWDAMCWWWYVILRRPILKGDIVTIPVADIKDIVQQTGAGKGPG